MPTKIFYKGIVFSFLGFSSQIIILATIARNIVIHKDPVGWLFPSGTSKIEKIILLVAAITLILVFIYPD